MERDKGDWKCGIYKENDRVKDSESKYAYIVDCHLALLLMYLAILLLDEHDEVAPEKGQL